MHNHETNPDQIKEVERISFPTFDSQRHSVQVTQREQRDGMYPPLNLNYSCEIPNKGLIDSIPLPSKCIVSQRYRCYVRQGAQGNKEIKERINYVDNEPESPH